MAKKIERIFGTNTSVCSWICVSVCSSDTTRPTTSPTSIGPAATSTVTQIASRPRSRTSAPFMARSAELGKFCRPDAQGRRVVVNGAFPMLALLTSTLAQARTAARPRHENSCSRSNTLI